VRPAAMPIDAQGLANAVHWLRAQGAART
jgi:hypothetical protein